MKYLAKTSLKLVILFNVLLVNPSYGQSVQEIKSNTEKYIWGEETGMTLNEADNNALKRLISQISVQVESEYEQFIVEEEKVGKKEKDYEFKEKVKSVVNTYSSATLHNAQRIVISNEPDARVFRYIERKNINEVFKNRKDKIFGFVDNANQATKENRIGDALRYYYWGFTLLKSHPRCNYIKYTDHKGDKHPLISWIPMKMNEIFSNIHFKVKQIDNEQVSKKVVLNVLYKNDLITNLDYSYWDGRDWSNLFNVKDGRGFLEFYGPAAMDKEEARLKVEYIYEIQANIDNELKTVMGKINPIPFRNHYYTIHFPHDRKKDLTSETIQPVNTKSESDDIAHVENPRKYQRILASLHDIIRNKEYESAKDLFTPAGYSMFQKLIAYGNAKILDVPDYTYYHFNDGVVARALPMVFSFGTN